MTYSCKLEYTTSAMVMKKEEPSGEKLIPPTSPKRSISWHLQSAQARASARIAARAVPVVYRAAIQAMERQLGKSSQTTAVDCSKVEVGGRRCHSFV
jgi:hypothetical protein